MGVESVVIVMGSRNVENVEEKRVGTCGLVTFHKTDREN
jgi:hypothetical protein